ncbi:PERF protein, partial [Crotophaga sulcirostris]|nr:PERF protein [Crotophaga sulcirostris]
PCQCGCSTQAGADGGGGGVTSECCSRRRGTARLEVVVGQGWGWWGDHFSKPDVYVRAAFGAERAQTATVWNSGRPRWEAPLAMGVVELLPGARLKVEVWDEDNKWDDDLLGVCEEDVQAGGWKNVVCFPGGGHLEFRYRATCGPALGGPLCQDYVPQAPLGAGGGFSRVSKWPPG